MKKIAVVLLLFIFVCVLAQFSSAQSGRIKSSKEQIVKPTPPNNDAEQNRTNPILPPDTNQAETVDDDVLRVETNLVTVPVSVTDKDGKYIPDLRQEDFHLFENGVEQEIAYFTTVDEPFTVALVLDMSGSTTAFRRDMQDAANVFVQQLRHNDRAMIVAFTEEVRFLSKPTTDKDQLRTAIFETNFLTGGTALYEAVDFTLNTAFKKIKGRKAIVLFTDGMDTASETATLKGTLHDAEEAEVLIYPIRYDTLALANGANKRQPSPSSLPPVLDAPGLPAPMPLPIPQNKRQPQPFPQKSRQPFPSRRPATKRPSDIRAGQADDYLKDLARKTGGRLYRAEKIRDISESFAFVAEELRHQYNLGFYPKPAEQEETRQIKARVNKSNVAMRARESYIYRPTTTAKKE